MRFSKHFLLLLSIIQLPWKLSLYYFFHTSLHTYDATKAFPSDKPYVNDFNKFPVVLSNAKIKSIIKIHAKIALIVENSFTSLLFFI